MREVRADPGKRGDAEPAAPLISNNGADQGGKARTATPQDGLDSRSLGRYRTSHAVGRAHTCRRKEPTPIVATAQSTLRLLPVPAPIGALLPRGGLARGTVVSVDGAASVLIGLLATITAAGGHVAVIGMPGLGLLAFHEQGGDLAKLALVPQPKDAGIDCAFSGGSQTVA